MPIDYHAACVDCQERGPSIWRASLSDAVTREWLQDHAAHNMIIRDEHHGSFDWPESKIITLAHERETQYAQAQRAIVERLWGEG